MTIHHHHTTMVPLQGRQHEEAMPRHEAVEQARNNGDLGFGLGHSVELPLVIWLGTGIDHANRRPNREVEDCSVLELAMQQKTPGLEEVVGMLGKAAQGHTALVHQQRLQVAIRALVLDPQPEGSSENVFM